MRNVSWVGRAAALAAVLVAVVGVAVLLLGSGDGSTTVKAQFLNASQLVKGDLVQVAGSPVGKVTDIALTSDGQAELTLQIDKAHSPLLQGTQLTVRQASLSGIANRYIDLRFPPGKPPPYGPHAVIPTSSTTTAVDLDQLFNVFGPKQRKALQAVIQGSAKQYQGQGQAAQRGFAYLNPALASTSVLFRELNRDTPTFTRFLTKTAGLVTDVADRRNDLAGLVDHLATTLGAVGRPNGQLASAIEQLPPFMRRANSTFVNLRSTLDTLRPLVEESKPVAKKLRPFLAQLRPFAQDAQPTVHDLDRLVYSPGKANDLIDLTGSSVPLAQVTVRNNRINGKTREGAFPASTRALKTGTPELAYARPYAVDLTGWFDDFSHPGVYDALGAASRVSPVFGTGSSQIVIPGGILHLPIPVPIGLPQGTANFQVNVRTKQFERCPGSDERGGAFRPTATLPPPFQGTRYCDLNQGPQGP
jgi:phospholipid/cholesterol/gamma-HCH transport system substrate-binding protein